MLKPCLPSGSVESDSASSSRPWTEPANIAWHITRLQTTNVTWVLTLREEPKLTAGRPNRRMCKGRRQSSATPFATIKQPIVARVVWDQGSVVAAIPQRDAAEVIGHGLGRTIVQRQRKRSVNGEARVDSLVRLQKQQRRSGASKRALDRQGLVVSLLSLLTVLDATRTPCRLQRA